MINILGCPEPGSMEWIPIWVICFFVFVLPIFLIVKVISYFRRSNDERRRLRMEISKLADELEQTRKNQAGK